MVLRTLTPRSLLPRAVIRSMKLPYRQVRLSSMILAHRVTAAILSSLLKKRMVRSELSQPFSSVVQMLRPGVGRWDISGGQVIKDDIQDEPNLFQASYYYGLNNYLTGYTGIQLTDNHYTAGLLGLGLNTAVGAFHSISPIQMSAFRMIKPTRAKLSPLMEQIIRKYQHITKYRGLSLFNAELPWP